MSLAAAGEAARVLALAFDPAVELAEDATSQRILDATLSLAAASGLRHLTMDDVAVRGRVGRMTVYRRFGSRTALIEALAVRECRRCLAQIAGALPADGSVDERLATLFVATLRVIREHPLLERLARVEPEPLLAELTRRDSAVFSLVHEFLVGLVREGQARAELPPGDPAILAELAVRLGATFVLMPQTRLPLEDEPAMRELFAMLLPAARS